MASSPHEEDPIIKVKVGILTVSDRCAKGEAEDRSGTNLSQLVTKERGLNGDVTVKAIVADDEDKIKEKLTEWCDTLRVNLILTTGGTGFAPRDVTPEATKAVIQKECPGLATAMLIGSLKITSMAMLSRPVCGIRGKTLIVNLPGSLKGSQECYEIILPALPHALNLLQDDKKKIDATHREIQKLRHGHRHRHHSNEDLQHRHHGNRNNHHRHHHSSEEDNKLRGSCDHEHHDVEKVARRPRHSPYPMVTFEEALNSVMDSTVRLGTEKVALDDALGYILASDVHAEVAVPPFPASIKDGYAVIANDGDGVRQVISQSTAGSLPSTEVTAGHVMRVTTGAPVPTGADAVVQVEDTELIKDADEGRTELEVRILKAPKAGQDIRPTGIDIKTGDLILNQGIKLGPAELGLAASVGVKDVLVYSKPTVAVMSTGDELAEPGEPLQGGQIYDSNRTSLFAMLKQHQFPTVDGGVAKDSLDALENTVKAALDKADVVITTGGVSMGEKDLLKHMLQVKLKGEILFGRVFLKPGKPTTFATLTYNDKKKLFFALPGNPASCMVCCNLFVLPSLRKMMGYESPNLTTIKVKLSSDTVLDVRPEFHRVILDWSSHDAMPAAVSTGSQRSSRLLSLKTANALLALPPRTEKVHRLKKGSLVDAYIIAEL